MSTVILCHACDLAQRGNAPPAAGSTRCARCRALLQRPANTSIDTAIALALCALVLLLIGNAYPLVALHINGSTRTTTLTGAAQGLYEQGYATLAVLVFLTTVVGPLLQIGTLLYVLVPLRRGLAAYGQKAVIRLLTRVRPWSFMEVFMMGTLVALVRLAKFAHVVPGTALWSCALLMLCLSALNGVSQPEQLWRWAGRAE
ncbi:MAG: paraquat-inducible protein A [Steroidobacteraceae bacterium]